MYEEDKHYSAAQSAPSRVKILQYGPLDEPMSQALLLLLGWPSEN